MLATCKKLLRATEGSAFVIATATMPLLIGAAALGIDVTYWVLAKRQLQRSADSAAFAGAHAVYSQTDPKAAAERDLQLNNQVALASTPLIENAPTSGAYTGDVKAVRVLLRTSPQVTFISFFMNGNRTLEAEATAAVTPDARYCMVALEEGSTSGITFSGNANVDLDCGVGSNSRGTPAISAEGSSVIKATNVGAVGGIAQTSNFVPPTEVRPYEPPIEDPYAGLPPANSFATNCKSALLVEPSQTTTLSPGCWNGMTLKGTVNLSPGTYVINGADLIVESQAVISGQGVTLIFTGSSPSTIANVAIAGGASLNLTAPTSGTFQGILMYQDSRANLADNSISGNAGSKLQGAVYFPKQSVTFTGNSSMQSECLRLVALRLKFTGSASAGSSCPSEFGIPLYGKTVRLVS